MTYLRISAIRRYRLEPFASAGAVLSVAAAIAIVLILVAFADTCFFGALSLSEPGRVVALWRKSPAFQSRLLASRWEYNEWSVRNRSFSGMAAVRLRAFDLESDDGMDRLRGAEVSRNFFSVIGARPILGGLLEAELGERNDENELVLGERFWRQRFGADPSIVGRELRISDGKTVVFRVVGVVAELPLLRSDAVSEDIFTAIPPLRETPTGRRDSSYWVYGRLRPGVSPAAANDDMRSVNSDLAREANDRLNLRVVVTELRAALVAPLRPLVIVLELIALLVTLAASAYVANLRLAAVAGRDQEVRTRFAMGAVPWQIGLELAIEGAGLVGLGVIVGLAIGLAGLRLASSLLPAPLGWMQHLRATSALTVGAAVAACCTILLAAAVPVFYEILSHRLVEGSASGRRRTRLQRWLLTSQLAATLALLSWALVTAGSVWRLWRVEAGFDATRVLVAEALRPLNAAEEWDENRDNRLEPLRLIPGVLSAAQSDEIPYSPNRSLARFEVPGEHGEHEAFVVTCSRDYFAALRIPLLSGRGFAATDDGTPGAAVVSAAAASRWFGGRQALGGVFRWQHQDYSIVGVVGDTKEVGSIRDGVRVTGLEEVTVPSIYVTGPPTKDAWRSYYLIRYEGDQLTTARLFREHLVAGRKAALRIYPLQDIVRLARSDSASYATVLGLVAILATVLACAAVYGLARSAISRRSREVAVRLALGALPLRVCATFQWELLSSSAWGVAVGVVAGFWGEAVLASLLFGADRAGLATVCVAVLALYGLVALSSWAALWRLSHVPPAGILRHT